MRLLFLLLILFSVACSAVYRPDVSNQTSENLTLRNLIIFYDKTEIAPEKLVQIAQQKGAELLYQYENFNAIAIHVPEALDFNKIKAEFTPMKGILGVEEDQIMHIQSTH